MPGGTIAGGPGFPESWIEEPEDVWVTLRNGPSAAWLGLTYPRFLVREPFGTGARRAKGFDFKEVTGSTRRLLWGLGAFVPVALMARGMVTEGRGVNLGRHLDLEGMPQALLEGSSGGSTSSLEASLRPSEARALMEAGLIPLLEFPEQAGLRVGGFQSVAGPDRPLAAWWRG
jgi:predicted component of type VI protein secretion system